MAKKIGIYLHSHKYIHVNIYFLTKSTLPNKLCPCEVSFIHQDLNEKLSIPISKFFVVNVFLTSQNELKINLWHAINN